MMRKLKKLKTKKVKASVFLSSLLILITCLLFLKFYQELIHDTVENDLMMIKYLSDCLYLHLAGYFY